MTRPAFVAAVALLLCGWSATADVGRTLDEVIAEVCRKEALASSGVGLLAVTAGGDTLAAVNPDMKLVPASNVKLITTGLALRSLGADFRFGTSLGYSGEVTGGTLHGDLYIVGGGDPTTGSRSTVAEPLESLFGDWAALLEEAGISRIDGRIVGDARFFDSPTPENLGWSFDDLGTNYGAGPTGLNFFENAQNFLITPGHVPGSKPNISPRYPETPWMRYEISARTGGRGTANTVFYVNTSLGPFGEFGGSFPVDRRGYTFEGSNRFGAYTCAWYFMNYLSSHGIEAGRGCADISSDGNLRDEPSFGDSGIPAASPSELKIIGGTSSAKLSAIAAETNHESDNFYAETMLKLLALRNGYPCGGDGPADAAEYLLRSMGLETAGRCRLVDGSGLSRKNYVSAGFFVDFLSRMMDEPCFGTYLKTLPVPGGKGTLEFKFGDRDEAFRSRVHMKSGSMNGVLCYSGYILPSSEGGETIVFSLLTNNVTASVWSVSPLVDRIIEALAAEN